MRRGDRVHGGSSDAGSASPPERLERHSHKTQRSAASTAGCSVIKIKPLLHTEPSCLRALHAHFVFILPLLCKDSPACPLRRLPTGPAVAAASASPGVASPGGQSQRRAPLVLLPLKSEGGRSLAACVLGRLGRGLPDRSSWPFINPVLILSVLCVQGLQSSLVQFVGYGFIMFGHLSVAPR